MINFQLDSYVNRPMVTEMFKIIGYQIPPNAVNSPDRKQIACSKLNIASPPFVLAFNPINYTSFAGTSNKKEASYSRQDFDRNSYLGNILDSLSGADIRVLVKYIEERMQCDRFTRAFPTSKTQKYFKFFDYLSYNDKLLDAFETRFGSNIGEGIEFVERYCKNNSHI